ncbi:uncharacterized protein LOC134210028 [Armigeres subalbatus]|uniref:uncharacterized protein LOC134210028 n=1 Tax=Armigeres subalbatus TaxID=124917 RepID=UPI002ED13A93
MLAISDLSYDIIILTETWLDSRTLSSQIFGNDYEVFRCDRSADNSQKATGGGVLVAVNKKLHSNSIENQEWNCLEQLWASIEFGDQKPDKIRECSVIETHCQSVSTILEKAEASDEMIVIGDFNLPGISWVNSSNGFLFPNVRHSAIHQNTSYLLDNYSSATLSQINHVTNQNGRSLDLCFVSVQDVAPFICEAPSPLVKLVNHHPPLLVSLHRKLENYVDTSSAVFFYDFRKADHRSISNLISSLDWGNILDNDDVDRAAETFSHVLSYIVDRHVPKIVKHNPPHAPWQTSGLRRLKSYKRAALRKFSKYRTLSLKRHYAQINHEYKRTAKSCFSQYQRGLQRKLKTHPKKFWKYVKEQRNESGLPSQMTLNGILASNSQDISRLFAEKFASVFSNERLSEDQIRNAMSSVPISGQAMSMVDINVEIVREAALKLRASYNPGPDGILAELFKRPK